MGTISSKVCHLQLTKENLNNPLSAAHLTLLDHLSKGEFFPMFTNPDPNTNQFLGVAQGGFCSKKIQKYSPNAF